MGYDRKINDREHRFGRDNYQSHEHNHDSGQKMDWEDEALKCVECGEEFTFRGKDKRFYQKMGYSKPKRCPSCREKNKARIQAQKQYS